MWDEQLKKIFEGQKRTVSTEDDGAERHELGGALHNENGPAYTYPGGFIWSLYGKKHREDGPAVKKLDGTEEWWQEGVQLTDEKIISLKSEFAKQAAQAADREDVIRRDAIMAPFNGTLRAVVAPEKASFKQKGPRSHAAL